ncbi:MAG: ATP-binding protein [Gemmatimonadota bacterium]
MAEAPFERHVLAALPLTIWTTDADGRITVTYGNWSRFALENGAADLARQGTMVGRSIFDAMHDRASREQTQRAMDLLRAGRSERVSWEFPCDAPWESRVFMMQVTAIRAPDDHVVRGFAFSTVDITPNHASREVLLDAGIALARAIDLERLYAEVGLQVQRAVRCDGLCLALADDETAALQIQYRTGYPGDAGALEARLMPTWLAALANGRVVVSGLEQGLELTAPMTTLEGVLGVITVWSTNAHSPPDLEATQRLLASRAAQTAAAIARAGRGRRVQQKRRLEAIGEVSTGVAHELRTPLFGISPAAHLLRFRAGSDPVVDRNVGRILREVERLNKMVTSLLEYGRPAALMLGEGDPDVVWDDVLDNQRPLLEARHLALHRVRADPGTTCNLDPEQLAQVFLNILVNACDAAPAGSTLYMQSQVLTTGTWRFRLTNGGMAIPPEVLPRVFEIFFSTKSGGTGIGLALCQRIVEDHGGTIGIESTPEAGTTVTLTLPAMLA